jgi:hypothetical protein
MGERYEIRTVEQSDRWGFRIVVAGAAADAAARQRDGNTHRTREYADRAGRLALAAKLLKDTAKSD